MRRFPLAIFVMFLFCLTAPIIAADKLIAYPVPLDPNHQTMSLKCGSNPVVSGRVEIYDINGDLVLKRETSDVFAFKWKGYNSSGRKVASGLYIVKVQWEESDGKVNTDTVRVTVIVRRK